MHPAIGKLPHHPILYPGTSARPWSMSDLLDCLKGSTMKSNQTWGRHHNALDLLPYCPGGGEGQTLLGGASIMNCSGKSLRLCPIHLGDGPWSVV